ncbi:MAG: hypothetical protein ACKOCI_01650 [Cyanobium sp.]
MEQLLFTMEPCFSDDDRLIALVVGAPAVLIVLPGMNTGSAPEIRLDGFVLAQNGG